MSDTWVADASPLITLAKIGRLQLLLELCGELLVPQAVSAEILAGPPSNPARQALERGWGTVVSRVNIPPELHEWGLGAGETAVLALSLERRPATALLDDAAARKCAKALGLETIGTLGAVLRAKRKALVPSAAELLKALRAANLRLDDDVVRSALRGVGETWE